MRDDLCVGLVLSDYSTVRSDTTHLTPLSHYASHITLSDEYRLMFELGCFDIIRCEVIARTSPEEAAMSSLTLDHHLAPPVSFISHHSFHVIHLTRHSYYAPHTVNPTPPHTQVACASHTSFLSYTSQHICVIQLLFLH